MDATLQQLTKLNLTENQIKVIKDKYLKNAPTIEQWLKTICHNIALSELLYSPKIDKSSIFEGVKHQLVPYFSRGKTNFITLLHYNLADHNKMYENFNQYIKNLEHIYNTNTELVAETEEKFYNLLSTFKFLPNSPTLMNAGRDLQQLSGCYVLPVGDSIEEIYTAVKNMALIHKSGGGTGFSFSSLRPGGDAVKSTKGISSGPISFMQIFDKSTDVVKQGGTRRGANMGILHYTHPDIFNFISLKQTSGVMENFNLSVTIDNRFMEAIKNDEEYALVNPRTKEIVRTVKAKKVWQKLIKGAWETGDPGIIMIDRVNKTASNATPQLGEIVATNPCGEQPLLPYESCNLGSINLYKFVNETTHNFDYEALKECVFTATHFLDNVIDVNNYPLPEIEEIVKKTRKIGLGVMGWAEALVMLGIPYNSVEALNKAEEVMKFINDSCMECSEQLAIQRGVFPAWEGSIYDKESRYFKEKEAFPRNSARTTIAPTGTIGITAGLQGAGIEPFFAVAYVRYNAAGIDALKKGEKPLDKDTFFEVNPLFEKIAEQHNYFGLKKEELYVKINDNHKSIVNIKEIPVEIQNLFLTAHDLNPKEHVLMQCAFQRHIDNAVSKTVNLRNEATEQDVEEVYRLAFENGAKGVTIYRDGSKQIQVLNIHDKKSDGEGKSRRLKEKVTEEKSDYYMIETGQGPIHIHINYDEYGPTRIFANISPVGTEVSGLTGALAIVISKYLELGGDPVRILKHLNSIKSERPFGFGKNKIDSVPHALSVALRNHLVKIGKIKPINSDGEINSLAVQKTSALAKENLPLQNLHCPKCYSSNVGMAAGCFGVTCFDCGHSECS